MTIQEIADILENWAPLPLAEAYDNVGLITGDAESQVTGVLICLDSTESVVREAMDRGCNLILAHHPIIFKGLKKITGSNYVERTLIQAIRHGIAVYALHTNLDNLITGVNAKIGQLLELQQVEILEPHPESGRYEAGTTGAGLMGKLPVTMTGEEFLHWVKDRLKLPLIKHTVLPSKPILNVAVCGGAGSFLIPKALRSGADAYVTSDLKYHEYFDAGSQMLLMDIGHFESERFTIDLMEEYLNRRLSGIRVLKTGLSTNPVQYFV